MVKVEIKDKFDLGYIVCLDDGRKGQLRAIEMKEDCLRPHLEGREEDLFGSIIEAYVIKEVDNLFLLSQFSNDERKQRDVKKKSKIQAIEDCQKDQEFQVELIEKVQWGFLFKQVSGCLEYALKNENIPGRSSINVGDIVIVKVAGHNDKNRPIFVLKSNRDDA